MMTFKEWKLYWKQLDWTRKWFPLFVLLRPITDNFYKLKEISTFLSPIYIMGVLTPVLALAALAKIKQKRIPATADEAFRIWGILTLVNCIALLLIFFSIDILGNCIKYLTPVVMFFYLRNFIQSKTDLKFVLQTFLYSAIFPFCMMYYEILLGPINPEYASIGRGGGARIRGEYADSMNYAIYLIGAFLCYGYFFLEELYSRNRKKLTSSTKLSFVFVLCLGAAVSLRHVATWGVFLTIGVLLLFYNTKNVKGIVFFIFIAAIILPFFARPIYDKQIYPLVAKEYNVMSGEQDVKYAFNGRMSRWERYFEIWDEMPQVAQLLGVAFSGSVYAPIMTGGGMHNDYIRNMFLSGIVGVLFYIIFFFLILARRNLMRPPERFLLIAGALIIMLYSITTLPTIYPGLFNLLYPVYAFALLPRSVAYNLPPRKQFVYQVNQNVKTPSLQ